jgi:uncharacterized membrane protein
VDLATLGHWVIFIGFLAIVLFVFFAAARSAIHGGKHSGGAWLVVVAVAALVIWLASSYSAELGK